MSKSKFPIWLPWVLLAVAGVVIIVLNGRSTSRHEVVPLPVGGTYMALRYDRATGKSWGLSHRWGYGDPEWKRLTSDDEFDSHTKRLPSEDEFFASAKGTRSWDEFIRRAKGTRSWDEFIANAERVQKSWDEFHEFITRTNEAFLFLLKAKAKRAEFVAKLDAINETEEVASEDEFGPSVHAAAKTAGEEEYIADALKAPGEDEFMASLVQDRHPVERELFWDEFIARAKRMQSWDEFIAEAENRSPTTELPAGESIFDLAVKRLGSDYPHR